MRAALNEPVVPPMQIQNVETSRVEDEIVTPSFVRSVTGSEMNSPGLNLEVVLNEAHAVECGNLLGQRLSEISEPETIPKLNYLDQTNREKEAQIRIGEGTHCVVLNKSIPVAQKGQRNVKVKNKGAARVQRKQKGSMNEGAGASLNLKKGAIFRSAVAAISLSMASKSGSGQLLLNEAEASLQIGKVLGLNYDGNEVEVLSKLVELEGEDKERMLKKGGAAV